jgi:hypothetical protein
MSQNFEFTSQEFSKGGSTTGGATGTVCGETSLYLATDGKAQFIELIEAGQLFPPYPGGKGTSKTTWTRLNKTTDGQQKTSFEGTLVPAGTA